jgi:hypothetical protein
LGVAEEIKNTVDDRKQGKCLEKLSNSKSRSLTSKKAEKTSLVPLEPVAISLSGRGGQNSIG